MGAKASDIIKIMKGWIGADKRQIIDLYNSHTPLAQGYKVQYADAWCDTTVSAAFIKANATDLIGGTECGVERHINLFKAKGIWQEDGNVTPNVGDIICYNWDDSMQPNDGFADHIGIVEKVEGTQITVIEGNYNNAVKRRTIPVGWGYIRGYAQPKYDAETEPKKEEKAVDKILRVIDISYAQGYFDWDACEKAYKAGTINGVIIRCGYGSDITSQDDVQYGRNVYEAEKRNIPYGIYLYSYADSQAKIESEIQHTIRLAKNRQPKIGVFIDLEENNLGYIAKSAGRQFVLAMNKLNYKGGIYCGAYFYKAYMLDLYKDVDSLWWIAGYGTNTGVPQYDYKPNPGFEYDGWQYTSVYHMTGWDSGLDASEWYTVWEESGQNPGDQIVKDTTIAYRGQCQTFGWLPAVKNGQICGTVGQAKRLEAIKIAPPDDLELEVDVHMQNIGWRTYKGVKRMYDAKGNVMSSGTESSANDPIMGTVGQSRRLEAIRIRCTRNDTGKKIRYQAHCQDYGWMNIVGEGEIAGTVGQSKRLEAIKIWLE